MFVYPKGNAPTKADLDALTERIIKLEQKIESLDMKEQPKRGRPRKEELDGHQPT